MGTRIILQCRRPNDRRLFASQSSCHHQCTQARWKRVKYSSPHRSVPIGGPLKPSLYL